MKRRKKSYNILAAILFFCIIGVASAQEPYTVETDLTVAVDVSAEQLDEFIKGEHPDSPLIGLGQAWIDAGNKYGINPVYLMSHAIHETGWGLGNDYLVLTKNNIYGYGAYDENPNENAVEFSSREECIDVVAGKIKQNYLAPGGMYFHEEHGPTLKGMNVNYATDTGWGNKIANIMNMFSSWQNEHPTQDQNSENVDSIHSDFQYPLDIEWKVTRDFVWVNSKGAYHLGEDVMAPEYLEVYAASDGIVRFADNDISGYGSLVIIEHPDSGVTTLYGHLSKSKGLNVKVGDSVDKHQLIGKIGNDAENGEGGPHLHFGIRKGLYSTETICGKWPYVGYSRSNAEITHEQYREMWYDPSDFIASETYTSPKTDESVNWEFNVPGDLEGWDPHNLEGARYSVEGGRLFIDPAGSDPWIEMNGLYIDTSNAKYVNLGMSSNCPDNIGTVYFTTSESPSYGDDKKVQFTVRTGPAWYDYSVSMTDNSLWKGTVTGIRIDPANSGIAGTNEDTVGFEYIRVEESGLEESGPEKTGPEESEEGIIPEEISADQVLEKSPVSEEEVEGIMGKVSEFIEMFMGLFEGLF